MTLEGVRGPHTFWGCDCAMVYGPKFMLNALKNKTQRSPHLAGCSVERWVRMSVSAEEGRS